MLMGGGEEERRNIFKAQFGSSSIQVKGEKIG